MASDWSASMIVRVTEANVRYIVTGTDPNALGVATISGDASRPVGDSFWITRGVSYDDCRAVGPTAESGLGCW